MPKTFQRSVFMSFSPPFTEAYLQKEKGDTDELATKWQYEIKPILNEYIKDGILLSEAQEVVDNLYV